MQLEPHPSHDPIKVIHSMETIRFLRRSGAKRANRESYLHLRREGIAPSCALANALSLSVTETETESVR